MHAGAGASFWASSSADGTAAVNSARRWTPLPLNRYILAKPQPIDHSCLTPSLPSRSQAPRALSAGHHSTVQPGASFHYTAAGAPQPLRGQTSPQPFQISVPATGATYAGTLRQPDVPSVTTVYHGNGLAPAHQDASPLLPPPLGFGGGTGATGAAAPQSPLLGFGTSFNAADADPGRNVCQTVDGDLQLGAGLPSPAAAQWANSALAAGYVPGGASTLGNYEVQGQVGVLAAGSLAYGHGGGARPNDHAGAAGLVSNTTVTTRGPAANGFAAGGGVATAGYAAVAPAAAGPGLVGQLQQQPQQQQKQAGGGEQPHVVDPAAAALVAEHLEAAHRAYKAGRHLEALQLCNTVCKGAPTAMQTLDLCSTLT